MNTPSNHCPSALPALPAPPATATGRQAGHNRRALAAAALLALAAGGVQAQGKVSDGIVKIGKLTDMSGLYPDSVGPGAVIAAKMAIADFGGKVLGFPIELVVADTQNKIGRAHV